MSSSGWQGRKDFWSWGRASYFQGDLSVDSLVRTQSGIVLSGKVALIYRNKYGQGGFYNYDINATPTNGSTVYFSRMPNVNDGDAQYRDYKATVILSKEDTSVNFSVVFRTSDPGASEVRLTWTLTFEAAKDEVIPPSGLKISYVSDTWESVTCDMSIDSYGVPDNREDRVISAIILPTTATSVDKPYRFRNANRAMVATRTIDNTDYTGDADFGPIKGMMAYKIGMVANNRGGGGESELLLPEVRYLPPAPGTLAKEHPKNTDSFTINYATSATNNITDYDHSQYSVTMEVTIDGVSQEYSFSVNAGEVVAQEIHVPYEKDAKIIAYQTYCGKRSEESVLKFTNTDSIPPTMENYGTHKSKVKWNSIGTYVNVRDFGIPANREGRYVESRVFEVKPDGSTGVYKYARAYNADTGVNIDFNIDNLSEGDKSWKIVGMMPFKTGYLLSNTDGRRWGTGSTVRFTPPSPGSLSYSHAPDTERFTFKYQTANDETNYRDYDIADYAVVVKYTIEGQAPVTKNFKVALGELVTVGIDVSLGKTATVVAYQTYKDRQSEQSSANVVNSTNPYALYLPVEEGGKVVGKQPKPAYGPVKWPDGEYKSKRIFKAYESVDGVARLTYTNLERPQYKVEPLLKTFYEVGNLFGDTIIERQGAISVTINQDTFPDYQDPYSINGIAFAVYIGTKDFTEITVTLNEEYFTTITPANVRDKNGALCAYFIAQDGNFFAI